METTQLTTVYGIYFCLALVVLSYAYFVLALINFKIYTVPLRFLTLPYNGDEWESSNEDCDFSHRILGRF